MPLISRLAATSTIVLAALQAHASEQVAGRILIADAMTGQVILDNGDAYHFKNPRVLLGLAPGETISIQFEDTGDVPVALGFQRRANKPGTEPKDRPLWRADGGDGNSNGGGDGNSNGSANGSSNGGGDGSSNGGGDGNSNGSANGSSNGSRDGSSNGGGDGNSNGNANGNSNGNSNGHSNGSSNGSANGSSNGGYEWKNQRQAQLE